MSALERQTPKEDNPQQDLRTRKALNSVLSQILEHVGLDCEHCKQLLHHVSVSKCDKCGKESDSLEQVNPHSDFLYCPRCLEAEI